MKDIKDVCFIVQARVSSQRSPRKMIKPFANTYLVDILCKKIKSSSVIPIENFFFSAYEKEIVNIVESNSLQIFHRSQKSALSEGPISEVMEYHDKLNFKYSVVISACCPLLKTETIDSFIDAYLKTNYEGMCAVVKKNTYYWNKNHELISRWEANDLSKLKGMHPLDTKLVEGVYEAAHVLYAGRMDTIKDNIWMAEQPFKKNYPVLFEVPEYEVFDIDHEWQFKVAEALYKESIS